jgi:hypothetical protein
VWTGALTTLAANDSRGEATRWVSICVEFQIQNSKFQTTDVQTQG